MNVSRYYMVAVWKKNPEYPDQRREQPEFLAVEFMGTFDPAEIPGMVGQMVSRHFASLQAGQAQIRVSCKSITPE